MLNRFSTYDVEKGGRRRSTRTGIRIDGLQGPVTDLNSGLQGIIIDQGKLYSGADLRREGIALGDLYLPLM